jgi:four helix bundle protein
MALIAIEVALQLIEALRVVHDALALRDPSLADQIKRACTSIPLNIGEGSRRAGKDRLHHYRIAAGSAEEVRMSLRVAQAWGYLTPEQTAASLEICDRLMGLLWGLTN